MICLSALILALMPSFFLVFAAEILHGLSAGILTPAIAAISLGLVGRRAMSVDLPGTILPRARYSSALPRYAFRR